MKRTKLSRSTTAMLVEDDAALLRSLKFMLESEFQQIWSCRDTRSAKALLAEIRPDFVLLDFSLPDGTAFELLQSIAQSRPTPTVIAMSGVASSEDAFALAQRGVRGFLQKPFGINQVRTAMELACQQPIDLRFILPAAVGQRSVHDVVHEVRTTMIDEALARANGSRRGAAQLLRVSRQLLQYMVRNRTTA